MNEQLRKSLPARATAAGFCLLVLFGNLWVGYAIINAKPPVWVSYGFSAGMAVVVVAGVALGGLALYLRFVPRPPEPAATEERDEQQQ